MAKKTAEQLQSEIHARAAIVRKAYEDWKAANANNPNALYTLEEQKRYLPKGFKNPKGWDFVGGWQKAKELGLDAYDTFGNIIPRSSMVPAGYGNAISRGQYVAPNVMASAMGAPQEEISRILAMTRSANIPDAQKIKTWYKYPTGNWSNVAPPPGTNYQTFTGIQANIPFGQTTPPGTITPPGTTPTTYDEWLKANPMPTPDYDYNPDGTRKMPVAFGSMSGSFGPSYQSGGGGKYTAEGWNKLQSWKQASTEAKNRFNPSSTSTSTGAVTNQNNVASAAANLANASKPTVPNFIQPYQKPSGFGSYGESDIF